MTSKLMTNIDVIYYNFIEKIATEQKLSKRKILEKIIEFYIKSNEQKKLEDLYKNMSQDKDYLNEMVENTKYFGTL